MWLNFNHKESIIFYRKVGNGNPVLLLHGFGEDGSIWNNQIDFLKNSCTLIIPDLPGSGKSGLLPNVESIEAYADCMASLITHEQLAPCIVLGHSMGGYITLALAEKYPHLLKALGLIHSTAFADTAEKKENRLRGIEIMRKYGAAAFLKNTIPNLFAQSFKQDNPDIIETQIKSAETFNTEACVQYYYAMMNRPDKSNFLQSNEKPILFVLGTEDIAAPMPDLLLQIKMSINVHSLVLENVGHMGMLEKPDKINKELLYFITAN